MRVDIGRAGKANLGARVDKFLSPLRNITKVTSYSTSQCRDKQTRFPGGRRTLNWPRCPAQGGVYLRKIWARMERFELLDVTEMRDITLSPC